MAIINMVAQGSWWWGWGNIGEPLNLTVTASWLDVTITWKDNVIWTIPPTTFQKSELVRKIGSAPTSPSDWTLVVTETVMDTYETTGYVDQWLTDWETYYYRVFSYSDLGGISYCDAESVTPTSWWWTPWANTLVYLPLDWDALDQSGNSRDGTLSNNQWSYSWEYVIWASWKKCFRSYLWASSSYGVSGWRISWNYSSTALWSWDRSISIWIKFVWPTVEVSPHWIGSLNGWTPWEWFWMFFAVWEFWILRYYDDPYMTPPSFWNTWHNIIVTYSSTNLSSMYIDWVKQTLTNNPASTFNTLWIGYQLWTLRVDTPSQDMEYYMSEYIIESKERTAQEVANYFNLTKWDYWIS